MSLDWALALLSLALWGGAYGGYFARDLRGWWWRRRHRAELLAIRRAQGYAAAMRRATPSRHRAWTPPAAPAAPPAAPAAARPGATIIPFPAPARRGGQLKGE